MVMANPFRSSRSTEKSTCVSQNVQTTPVYGELSSENFDRIICKKIAHFGTGTKKQVC